MLTETPICQPVLFSIVGLTEGCIIERGRTGAHRHPAPAAGANHWLFPGLRGVRPGPFTRLDDRTGYMGTSHARQDAMADRMAAAEGDRPLAWLAPPILTDDTRLACLMRPGPGTLTLVGMEDRRPATHLLHLAA
jgi:hypothetical protein